MTVVRKYKTPAVGGYASTLPIYRAPIGGLTPANRWLAGSLANGAVPSWPAVEGGVPLVAVGAPTALNSQVTLDSIDDAFTATPAVPRTFYMVARPGADIPEALLSYGAIGLRMTTAAGQFAVNYSGGTFYPLTGYTAAKHALVMLVADGVNPIKLYLNGVGYAGPAAATTPFSSTMQVGRYAGTTYGGLNLVELGTFAAALTDAQALAVYEDLRREHSVLQ